MGHSICVIVMAGVLCLLVELFVARCAVAVSVRFITTPRTPAFISRLIAEQFPHSSQDPEALVLDYSYDEELSFSMLSERTIVMWASRQAHKKFTYETKFTQYLERLNFTEVVLIADTAEIAVCQWLLNTFPSVYAEMIITPHHADANYSQRVIGKVIKPSGHNLFAFFTDELSTWNLLEAFKQKRLLKEGFAFILSRNAAYFQQFGVVADGLLYVAPAVSASARSVEEAERMKLAAVAQWCSGDSSSTLFAALSESPVLVNIDKGQPVVVATDPLETVVAVFPGSTTLTPKRQQGLLTVSVHYVWRYPDDSIATPSVVFMRGVQIAFEEKNNGTELFPMFHVATNSLELSRIGFNSSFTRQSLAANQKSLGLMHFPIPRGDVVMGVFSVLKELNISLPMSISLGSTALSSPKNYPLFVRPRTSNTYSARVFATVFKHFGWRRVAVLYNQDNADNEDLYRAFLNYSQEFDINVTNSETSRALTEGLFNSPTKQLNESLQEIARSSARILVAFHDFSGMVVKALYDLGFRSRFLLVAWSGLSSSIFTTDIYKHCKAAAKGALLIFPRPFIGKVGQNVLQEMIAKDGLNYYPNSCFFYDAAMLYLHATDYLIRMGHDYENPYEIVKAMRTTHFAGCSGTVTIAPGLNDKSEAEYSITNLKYYESNDSLVLEDAMYYNPFSVVLFKAVRPFMWPDNSTVFTDTLISTFDCPFLEQEAHRYPTGKTIGLCVTFSICLATIAITAFIWKKWWCKQYPFLRGRTELSPDDMLQMIGILIEFFQFAAVGPESHEISHIISQITKSTTLQLEDVLSATGSTYWYLVKSVFACVGAYTFLCVMKLTGLERKLEWVPLWAFLMLFANLALPVLSNLLFLPIISILSKLYLCDNAIGDYLTSTFLNKDCYTFCWSGAHLTYIICGSIALALYIPLGVYAKPMWQEAQAQLHIRAQPLSLMVKSVVQVVLLTLSNCLKQDYQDIHAGFFFPLIVLYLLFKCKVSQYNYHRCAPRRLNLWDLLSTCAVLSFSAFAFVSNHYPSISRICLLVFLSVAAVYVVLGAVVQAKVKRFESHFFRRKMNESPIFHFAFTFGARATQYLDLHFNNSYFTENEILSRVPHIEMQTST